MMAKESWVEKKDHGLSLIWMTFWSSILFYFVFSRHKVVLDIASVFLQCFMFLVTTIISFTLPLARFVASTQLAPARPFFESATAVKFSWPKVVGDGWCVWTRHRDQRVLFPSKIKTTKKFGSPGEINTGREGDGSVHRKIEQKPESVTSSQENLLVRARWFGSCGGTGES